MSDLYIAQLRRQVEERNARRAAEIAAKAAAAKPVTPVDPLADLKARVTSWYKHLPPELRVPYYFMKDLAKQLRATPQDLGVVLDELGWTRRRSWTRGRPYRNRWHPPEIDQAAPQPTVPRRYT